jgi:hypothetical protein
MNKVVLEIMLYVEISFGQLVDYEVTLGYSQVHSNK